jgi:hypothetical protein
LSAAAFFLSRRFLCVFEPVAFSVGFDDVDAVCEPVEQCAGESLVVTPQA